MKNFLLKQSSNDSYWLRGPEGLDAEPFAGVADGVGMADLEPRDPSTEPAPVLSADDEAELRRRLTDLGYMG